MKGWDHGCSYNFFTTDWQKRNARVNTKFCEIKVCSITDLKSASQSDVTVIMHIKLAFWIYVYFARNTQTLFSLLPGSSKAAMSPYDEESKTLVKGAKQFISDGLEWKRIHPVSMMVQHHRPRLLHHPLTKAWIVDKWNLYISYIFLVLLFIEMLFVTSLTIFMSKTE